jgi:hypothetical protein
VIRYTHGEGEIIDPGLSANEPDKLDLHVLRGATRRRLRYKFGRIFGDSHHKNQVGSPGGQYEKTQAKPTQIEQVTEWQAGADGSKAPADC